MRQGIGLGIGINRSNYAQGIFGAYRTRVIADGGVVESGTCVDAVSSLLQSASLLLIPSGYKSGVAYSEIPTNGNGDLTWSRASTAYRTNASGIIEEVAWNLFLQSEDFDSLSWAKTNATITANSTTSPNGTTTADTIVSIGADGRALQAFNVLENQNYTFSVWLKSTTSSNVNAAIRSAGNATSVVVTPEWQRFTITQSYPANATRFPGISGIANTESIYAWGAQLVVGTDAKTYLPVGSTRNNYPRLSYMYGSCPAVLLEPQRTNLAKYSNEFSNATWIKATVTVTANYSTSPDGTTNATRIVPTGGTGGGYLNRVYQSIDTSGLLTYTLSVWAKSSASSPKMTLAILNAAGQVFSITNQWQRYSLQVTGQGLASNFNIYAGDVTWATGVTNSTNEIEIFGAQLEAGAYPTTYIPTTTASATRVADSFSRSNIFTNGLISASGGTWFVELRNNIAYSGSDFINFLFIGNNTNFFTATAALTIVQFSGSTERVSITKRVGSTNTQLYLTLTDTVKIAIKWNGSTADVFVNGTKVVSATSFTSTLMENLVGGGTRSPLFIQQMALFPTPLSDAQCTTLTTL